MQTSDGSNNRTSKLIIDNMVYEIPDNNSDDEGTLLQTVQTMVNRHVQQKKSQPIASNFSNIPQPIKSNLNWLLFLICYQNIFKIYYLHF
jgi:hypothetical protein